MEPKKIRELSDEELQNKLHLLAQEDRRLQLETIRHLREVERRMLYAKRGFPSLYEYCVEELRFSEGAAYRRIAAIRLLAELPESMAKLESGALNLTTLTMAQQYFRKNRALSVKDKEALLSKLENKSKKEAEQEIRKIEGVPDLMFVRLALTEVLRNKLELVKQSLRMPENVRLEELLETLVDACLHKVAQESNKMVSVDKKSSSLSRHIPAKIKVAVWKRDEARCVYQDPGTGKRCEAKYSLQFDHIIPFSAGGSSTYDNLRLLCPTHNQLHAMETVGEELMQKFLPKLC